MSSAAPAFRVEMATPRIHLPARPFDGEPLDLIVEPGRRIVFVGRSGAGKSLLARLFMGQLPRSPVRTTGTVRVQRGGGLAADADLAAFAPGSDVSLLAALRGGLVSYVPQGGRENLVPGWTVGEHFQTLLPDTEVAQQAALDVMEALGLPPTDANLSALATELSEGMIRRILVSLAMAQGAQFLVLDEPTTGLDPKSRSAFRTLLQERVLDEGRGILVVTHDMGLAGDLEAEAYLVDDGALAAHTNDLTGDEGPFLPFVRAGMVLEHEL